MGVCTFGTSNGCVASGGSFAGVGSACTGSYGVLRGTTGFEDITSTGTHVTTLTTGTFDDGYLSGVVTGFTFNYFGTATTTVSIDSNGWITIGATPTSTTNYGATLPASGYNSTVGPAMNDMNETSAGGIYYQTKGTAPYRRFIVEWSGAPHYGSTTPTNTFEVILYESSDVIEFRYGTMGITATTVYAGIQNPGGTAAINVGTAPASNSSVLLAPGAQCGGSTYPTGACCNGNTCSVGTYAACQLGGGGYQGDGASCTPVNPCVTGACCTASGCSVVVASVCTGVYGGDNSTCSTVTCGSCCVGTTCSYSNSTACAGSFTAAGSCSPNLCAGSCCDTSTSICSVVATGTCTGLYGGDGSTCVTVPCPPPANDTCAGAIGLSLGVPYSGNNSTALSTNDGPGSTCTSFGNNLGVWFYFTTSANVGSLYRVDTCGTTFDTVLTVYGSVTCQSDATTASGTEVGCNDDNFTICGTSASAVDSLALTPSTTYYVRVSSYSATTGGNFNVLVTEQTVTGICCNTSTGACTLLYTSQTCASGTTQGSGTTCGGGTPDPSCPPSGICCNTSTGACSVNYGGTCASGTSSGTGTTCGGGTPDPSCPASGSCCVTATGACTLAYGTSCASGSIFNAGGTCGGGTPDPNCPATACCDGAVGGCVVIFSGSCAVGTPAPGNTCSPNTCTILPSTCQNFDGSSSLPAGWTSSASGIGTGWAIVSDQSHSASNSVFAADPAAVSSDYLTLPAVTIGGTRIGVDFWSYYDTESTFDGWTLEISSDGGATFTNVGDGAWTLNGYNATISSSFMSDIAGQRAFSGTFTTWTEHTAVISGLTAGNSYILRFHMASDDSVNHVGVWLDDICVYAQPNAGACCETSTGLCSIDAPANCGAGHTFNGAASCSPNPCPPPPGVCCRGATCNAGITIAANCTVTAGSNAGAHFATPYTACNASGNTTTPCCYADYDKVNGIQVADIFAYLNDWFAGKKYAIPGGDGAHGTLAVQNIFDFLNLWFAGGC
jgi:hypothetical protein